MKRSSRSPRSRPTKVPPCISGSNSGWRGRDRAGRCLFRRPPVWSWSPPDRVSFCSPNPSTGSSAACWGGRGRSAPLRPCGWRTDWGSAAASFRPEWNCSSYLPRCWSVLECSTEKITNYQPDSNQSIINYYIILYYTYIITLFNYQIINYLLLYYIIFL